ncbi:MAG: CHAD domain-containing protein [Albidovulum sp.]
MAYSITPKDRSATKALRRIARERLEDSVALVDADRMPRVALIHELRKNVKKTRALLRLVRPGFDAYARENAALRDAGRMLSDLRDADVLAQSFDNVATRVYMPPEALAALRDRVIAAPIAARDPDAVLKAHAEAIAEVAGRARKGEVAEAGFEAFEKGLERSWTAAQKAMRAAETEPSGEALHLWRKRVKDHWYHARILQPIWPEMMTHHMAAAETLGETLGDARDLAYLAEALAALPEAAEIRAAARDEEARLLADARALGRPFLSEPAGGLSCRWRGWWDIWREA